MGDRDRTDNTTRARGVGAGRVAGVVAAGQKPVYDYFGPANTLLMYATEYIPGVKVVVMTTFANLMGLNGRAAAAEEARKTLAIAMDPLNETADGYGPEVASVQFQYTQQLQS